MRKDLSIVLAGLLLILPVEQVLAQAAQQQENSVQQTTPPDGAAHLFRIPPVIKVPALAPETAPAWRSFAEKPLGMFAEPSLSNRDAVVGWSDWSNGKRVLVVVGVIVVAYVAVAVIVLSTCGDSCR